MTCPTIRRSRLLAALIASAASAAALAAPPLYRITDLGVPKGATGTHVTAIDDAGRVGGYMGHQYPAFIWTKATGYRTAPPTVNSGPIITALDGSGGALGYDVLQAGGYLPFHSSPNGQLTLLPVLGSGGFGHAYGINDLGTVIGDSSSSLSTPLHAVTWTSHGIVDRNPAGYYYSSGVGLNHAGQMLLQVNETEGGPVSGMIVQPDGTSRVLPPIAGDASAYGVGINAAGTVAGVSLGDPFNRGIPVIWRAEQGPLDLTVGSAYEGYAGSGRDINDAETVIGAASSPTDGFTFIWTAADGMMRLDDLIDPNDPLHGKFSFSGTEMKINDKGQIAVTGFPGIGPHVKPHALLLTPEN